MSKTFILTSIILFGLVFFLLPAECFADAAELLEQAGIFTDNGYRQQAEELYKRIVTDYPGTDYALKAQGELIGLSMSTKEGAQIQADIDGLITNYSGYADLPAVLCDIAASYGWSVEFERANGLYQQVIQQYPGSSAVRKAELGISRINAVSLIGAGDYTAAAVKVNKMLTDFSGHPYLPAALYHIAKKYEWSRKYEQARGTYQQIIQQYSDSAQAKVANLDVAKIDILSFIKVGDFDTARAKVDKLLEDFSGNLGLAEVLRRIAREYEVQVRYTDASNIHQQIIQRCPGSSQAGLSQLDFPRTKVLSLIESGNYTAASTEFAKLVQDNSGNPELPAAIYAVAKKYDRLLNYEQAKGLYRQITEQYPTSPVVNDAQWGFSKTNVLSLIKSGDYTAAGTALDKLVQDFSGHSELPSALCDIARQYGWSYEYERAKDVYQWIIQQYPDSSKAGSVPLDVARIDLLALIKSGNYSAAETELDRLLQDFSGHPGLLPAVLQAVKEYYKQADWRKQREGLDEQAKENFQNVKAIAEMIIAEAVYHVETFPKSTSNSINPEAHLFIAYCDYQLGEYAKAKESCQKVVSDWPDYAYTHYAQLLIASFYEKSVKLGTVPIFEADLQIERALIAVLEKDTEIDSKSIARATFGLGRLYFDMGRWADAANYFERFLEVRPEPQQMLRVIYSLGEACEKIGKIDLAADVYEEFIIKMDDPNNPDVQVIKAKLEELKGSGN